jgi:hypothetical protein
MVDMACCRSYWDWKKQRPFKYYQAAVQFGIPVFDDGSKGDFRWITKKVRKIIYH